MERQRFFFKLEMEQLPEQIWQQVKCSDVMKNMQVQNKSEIVDLIEHLPEPVFDKLRHIVRAIRDEALMKYVKNIPKSLNG